MYVMGVINSRRLGKSLGLDIIGADGVKRCNFNCVYCEVGNGRYEIQRGIYADFYKAISELEENLSPNLDVITFSGNGEPTLNLEIGRYIDAIHNLTATPVCVITNSSLLHNEDVFGALLKADIVMPSIDSFIEEEFINIDRPLNISLNSVKDSIIDFSKVYKGKLFLEVLFVKGYNDSVENIELLLEFVREIKPTELHLNTVDRDPAESLESFTKEELFELHNRFASANCIVKIY